MTPHQALIEALTVERSVPMPRWQLTSSTVVHRDPEHIIADRRTELETATGHNLVRSAA